MGEIPRNQDRSSPIRRLARLVEPIHTVCYYAPEVRGFTEVGFKGWWHAYFGYRAAPMGRVSAATVTAVFYNFAPVMVERAVPSCWDVMEPANVRALQLQLTSQALNRCMRDFAQPEAISESAATLRKFASGLPVAARPLYSAWAGEPWPVGGSTDEVGGGSTNGAGSGSTNDADGGSDGVSGDDLMALWHGCTLLREFRFDGHNIALAINGLDPLESHVMMTTHGHGNAATMQKIRGWTEQEWDNACTRLQARDWIDEQVKQTPVGSEGRRKIESDTDEMAVAVTEAIDEREMENLIGHLGTIVEHLVATGEVAGVWPPPNVIEKG